MRKPEDGKKVYDNIEIPEELNNVVKDAIHSMDKGKSIKKHRTHNAVRIFRYCGTAAAALLVCMTIGLNTNEVFAREMGELPIIGSLAKVLTIRSYHEKDEGHDITVNVPEIQLDETQTGDADAGKETFVGDINQEIQTIVDDYVADAKQKFAEYKEAFFATGGTEEEWGNRDIAVNVDYEVKYQSIIRQMKERDAADENAVYWGIGKAADDGMVDGFQTVDENTSFYINADGNPVVCFEKYEVAPGYMGFQEFEIQKPVQ